jgi:hypothetical protein
MMMISFQKQAILAIFLSVSAFTCYGEPQTGSGRKYIIKEGVGIAECPIKLCEEKTFSELFQSTKAGTSLLAPQHGVEGRVVRGRVKTMFFFFNSEKKNSFNGETEAGIGKDSSRDDVIRKYGKPNDILVFPVYLASGENGQEETLLYKEKGIIFTFVNNRLVDIRVSSPTGNRPDISIEAKRTKLLGEWIGGAYSPKIPFKEAFLTGQVGAVVRLEAGGKAVMFIPCDVNEAITRNLKMEGAWSLNDLGEFEMQFKEKNAGIKGMLTIDEESEDIDQLIIRQADDRTRKFGRFDRSQLNCN